jgi:mRNA interferase MazF
VKRGDFYRVLHASKNDLKDYRIYLVVSRQELIDTNFPTVICAGVCTKYHGYQSQVEVGIEEVNTALKIALAVE